MKTSLFLAVVLFVAWVRSSGAADYIDHLARLADPARRSEPMMVRLPKIVYWLEMARQDKQDVTNLLDVALRRVMTNQWAGLPEVVETWVHPGNLKPGRRTVRAPATLLLVTNEAPLRQFTLECLLRNHQIAKHYGCLETNSLEQLRQGRSPLVPAERADGTTLSPVEFVPLSLGPELAGVLANVELKPLRKTSEAAAPIRKRATNTRQRIFADKFLALGLLSAESHQRFISELDRMP